MLAGVLRAALARAAATPESPPPDPMATLTPAMLAAKPALAGAEVRSRAAARAAALVAKAVVCSAEKDVVSRRSALSLAAVRARAARARCRACPKAARAGAIGRAGGGARVRLVLQLSLGWGSALPVCCAGRRRRPRGAPGERGVRRGGQRVWLGDQRVGCVARAKPGGSRSEPHPRLSATDPGRSARVAARGVDLRAVLRRSRAVRSALCRCAAALVAVARGVHARRVSGEHAAPR